MCPYFRKPFELPGTLLKAQGLIHPPLKPTGISPRGSLPALHTPEELVSPVPAIAGNHTT